MKLKKKAENKNTVKVEPLVENTDGMKESKVNNKVDKPKKKGCRIFLFVGAGILGVLIMLMVIAFITGKSKGGSQQEVVTNGNEVVEEQPPKDTPVEEPKDEPIEEPTDKPKEDDKKEGEEPTDKKEGVTYENTLLGLKFNIPNSWFTSEMSDNILNSVKESSEDGKFSLITIPIKKSTNMTEFYASDNLNTKVILSVSPFTVKGAEKLTIESMADVLTSDFLKSVDSELGKSLKSQGYDITSYTDSETVKIGKYTCVLTDYSYNFKGKSYSIVQVNVPVGRNNIVFTGIADSGSNPIDKYAIIENMVKTLEVANLTLKDK